MASPPPPQPGLDELAERFLGLACLDYGDAGPDEWAEARALLADHPEITEGDVYVAAVAADTVALSRILQSDPAAAGRKGGPRGWEPLLYLAYARHDPAIAEGAVLTAAQLLLDAGADANAGFLTDGLPTPFTVLTGVFGEGERGPTLQPRHPHSIALGRLLLEAGADPNDHQALYNRMFESDDDHLELLFEFGLATGVARGQLAWAITHGMGERVRLLADHGADLAAPFNDGLAAMVAGWASADGDEPTPVVVASLTGHPEVVAFLVDRGVSRPLLTPGAAFVAAALAADRATVDQLRADDPALVDHVIDTRPGLVVWAAAIGSAGAVELLVELGFDMNAKGRTDIPSNQPWHTALHAAVENDDIALARTLLSIGADPNIKDVRFDATPLGWARFFDHPRLIDLLEPTTAADKSDEPMS